MAAFKKIGKTYCAYYYVGSGKDRKKKWVRLDVNKQLAVIKYGDLEEKLKARKFGRLPEKISWHLFTKEYLDNFSATNKVKESYETDKRAFAHFNRISTVVTLNDLTPPLLEQYKTKRKEEGVKESTINRELNSLKSMSKTAVKWNYLAADPWAGVSKFEESKSSPLPYTNEAMNLILDMCADNFELSMELLGVDAGLRRGEMANLKWPDVDFYTEFIHIVSTMGRRTKTKRERFVPMTPRLMKVLKALKKENMGEFVFMICGERVRREYLSVIHQRILYRAGVSGTLHQTRHKFGDDLSKKVPLNVVQDMMGHARITTTQIYLHANAKAKSEAIKKLPGYRSGIKTR